MISLAARIAARVACLPVYCLPQNTKTRTTRKDHTQPNYRKLLRLNCTDTRASLLTLRGVEPYTIDLPFNRPYAYCVVKLRCCYAQIVHDARLCVAILWECVCRDEARDTQVIRRTQYVKSMLLCERFPTQTSSQKAKPCQAESCSRVFL